MTLTSLENAIKVAGHDLVVGARALEHAAAKILASKTVAEAEGAANTVLTMVDPNAAKVVEIGEALLAKACAAVQAAGAAASAQGLNIPLDQTAVADIEAILPSLKTTAGVAAATPAPATA